MTEINSFMGIIEDYSNCSIVVFPISYEETVSYGKGTSKGPAAVINASYQVEPYSIEFSKEFKYDIFTLPILELEGDASSAVDKIYVEAKKHVDKFLVSLGGEHSISIGLIKAYKEKYSDLSILQIDAHSDLSEEYEGSKFSHACVMKRALDLGCSAVQVGIRSIPTDVVESLESLNTSIYYAKNVHDKKDWKDVVSKLSDNVYLTIDVDGLDPSLIPATGTPEPGGMEWYSVISLLKELFNQKNVVGADIVELAPISGQHSSDYIAAKLAFNVIAMKKNK